MVAIIFLAKISFGTASRFGEWGEQSIAESTLIVTKEKIARIEETLSLADDTFFRVVDPNRLGGVNERWHQAASVNRLVEAAAIIDDCGQIVAFFMRDEDEKKELQLRRLMEQEIVPLLDKYDSLDRYKHIHKLLPSGEYRLITHLTTQYEGEDYIACLIYDTAVIVDGMFGDLLANVGNNRVVNVVDQHNEVIYGNSIDRAGEFVVSRRFSSTLYKWRLQIAPTTDALFSSRAQERVKRFSEVMLIPLALGVIVLGLVVLYLSNVRERRLSSMKSDFVANVTHELKTPLSIIRMFGELLYMGKVKDEKKARHYYEVILRETERLTSLVDNVLNLSRIERGKGAYQFQKMDVGEAVDHAIEIYRHRLDKTGLRLIYNKEPELPLIRIDGDAITLAAVNLIDNAAKYAQGTDVVGVELSTHGEFVHLDVFDRGHGIPKGELKRVFERFFRGASSQVAKQRGSGIGLNLVQHIAAKHGGSVSVSSEPNVETRFTIKLPR